MLLLKRIFCRNEKVISPGVKYWVVLVHITLISTVFYSCSDSKLPLHSIDNNTGFISWNIDKVSETRELLLTKISEKSEVLIIPTDKLASLLSSDISEIIVSDNFILIIPGNASKTAPLLFSREGNFITSCMNTNNTYPVLNAIIDDRDTTIYFLSAGIHWFSYHIPDNKVTELPQLDGVTSLVMVDRNYFLFTSNMASRNWLHSGSLYSQHQKEMPGQTNNNLFNYMSYRGLSKMNNSIILQFLALNDTIYRYDRAKDVFSPVVGFFSESKRIEIPENVDDNPEALDLAAREVYNRENLIRKRVVLYCDDSYLLNIIPSDRDEFFFFEESTGEAYKTVKLTDDLRGGLTIDFQSLFYYPRNWGFIGNSDYLVYWFSKNALEKRLSGQVINNANENNNLQPLNELMNTCDSSSLVVFINKLRK